MSANAIRTTLFAAAAVSLAALTQPAAALTISQHPLKDGPDVNAILLKGPFVDGDTLDFQDYIAKLPKKPRTVVYLDSPGGNVRESLSLGTLFYQHKFETHVDARAVCTSACGLAFLGGRDANGKPMQVKVSTGRIGFHSFTRDFTDRDYSARDMKIVVQKTQTEMAGIADYLRNVDANLDVMRIMLSAPNSTMKFVSNDEAIELGFKVFDVKTNAFVDPAPVLERLAKLRAEEKLAIQQPPKKEEPVAPSKPKVQGPPAAASAGSNAPGEVRTPETRTPERTTAPAAPTTAPVAPTRRVPDSTPRDGGGSSS